MSIDIAGNALTTVVELKRWLNLTSADFARDDFLQEEINDWSDTIEKRLGRIIKSASYTDERHDGGKLAILLKNIPVTAISSITIEDTAIDSTDYTFDIDSGKVRMITGIEFDGGPGDALLSYTGGYATVPGDLKRAVKQIVAIGYYLSGHGRHAIAKSSESTGEGNVEYNRGPKDQEAIMKIIERIYKRR